MFFCAVPESVRSLVAGFASELADLICGPMNEPAEHVNDEAAPDESTASLKHVEHEHHDSHDSQAHLRAQKIPVHKAFGFGCCMGTADAVPGVSGGTIALILGFYDAFIDALANVVRLLRSPFRRASWHAAIAACKLLVPLTLGAITALYLATKLLVGKAIKTGDLDGRTIQEWLAENEPAGLLLNAASAPYIFALFFGLVLFSIPRPWQHIQEHRGIDWLLAGAAGALVAAISLLNPASIGINPLLLVVSGMLAISVMLLPGISGSLVLLIIGMYQPVSEAVHHADYLTLCWFFLGIVLGIISFVPLLRFILHRWHDRTMATLTGLMCGSLVALWPWKTHYLPKFIAELGPMYPQWPAGVLAGLLAMLAAVAGMLIIFALQKAAGER